MNDRLSLELNRCLKEARIPEWLTKKNLPDPERPPKREPCLQLLTDNISEVENLDHTD